jgi:phosphoglycerate dehydrogenase-like enzyme
MFRLAILDDYQDAALRLADWKSLGSEVEVQSFTDHVPGVDALAARLASFDGVFLMRERTQFPRELIERLPKLRLILTAGMKNVAIDEAAATERGIQICGSSMLPNPTAELTWGLILALARSIVSEDALLRKGIWQKRYGYNLRGKTLGIVGLGRLGTQVAAVGKTFGMELIAWSQKMTAERAAEAGARMVEKDELFARMKPTAFLVNTSRGPLIEEAALLDALRGRRIAGAALDVYDHEPLPADHPFLALDNVVLTPHLGYVTEENFREIYSQAAEDLRAFLAGKPIRTVNEVPARR